MKNHISKAFIVLWIINALFISYMLLEGSKYPLNLMSEEQVYSQLAEMKGVGEIKAESIAEHRKEVVNVKQLDTDKIKYSQFFTVRSWDMRTDVMYVMFGISLLIMLAGLIYVLIMLYKKKIEINVNKYIVLDSPKKGVD
jgi:hypothetical protein